MAGTLSPAEVERFRTEGYLAPFEAVTPRCAAEFRRRIEAFEERTGLPAEGSLKIKAHLAAPWMVDLACHPAILDVVESLLGPDILLLRSSMFAKDARDPRFVSWHQDSLYYGQENGEALTVWVAFTRSDVPSGCLRVIAGSHRAGNLPHDERKEARNLLMRGHTALDVDESRAVDLVLEPGQFSIHHERAVHGSNPNGSDDRRIGLAYFYGPTVSRPVGGRRPAVLVRGVDTYNNWDAEVLPRYECDPVCMDALADMSGRFSQGQFRVRS
jgi:hypothetical protein